MEQINSNIRLCYIPMTKLKTTDVGVFIHRPLCEAEASKNAILPYVLKRGCKMAKTDTEISKYLENLYGASLDGYTMKIGDNHTICFSGETISDEYAPMGEKLVNGLVELMLSVIFEPAAIEKNIIEQEKKNAKDKILSEINNKTLYAMKRCGEIMCEGDNFAISNIGTIQGIDAVNAENLRAHYDEIISSSMIDIYICGSADADAVSQIIKNAASKISFKEAQIVKSKLIKGGDVKNVTERMEVAQGKLSMGFRTNIAPDSDEYTALMILNSIFGGGAHSKLFNNVREKLSLCYYASSAMVKYKGIMYVNAGIEFENFGKAHDEILTQLDAIKKGEISDWELESSVKALQNDLEANKDDPSKLEMFYLTQQFAGTNHTIDELKEKIGKITKQDVVAAAGKIELDTVYFLAGKEEN